MRIFYEVAFPVLKEIGIRATVFVTTGFIDRQLYLWPDRVRALLETCAPGTYHLEGHWRNVSVNLRSRAEIESACIWLADQLCMCVRNPRVCDRDLSTSLTCPSTPLNMARFRR